MTRVKVHTLGAYADCFQIMDKALAAKGLVLTFNTHTQATQFRHRCYSARKTLANKGGVETPYDSMLIVKTKEEPTKLVFRFRSADDLPVTISGLDGQPLPTFDDDFARQAAALKKGLLDDLDI